jgi:hypothetical protein
MRTRHLEEAAAFTIQYAYTAEALAEVMAEMGVTSKDELVGTYGGGCMTRADYNSYMETLRRHGQERMDAIRKDKSGKGFIREMFTSMLAEDEYGFTCDESGVLDNLGLTAEDFAEIPALAVGLSLAKKVQRNPFDEFPSRSSRNAVQ